MPGASRPSTPNRSASWNGKRWSPLPRLLNGANRAYSLVKTGMVTEAVAQTENLTQIPSWNAGQWYNFACVYSLASGKMADRKEEYAERAMELLRKAVSAGWNEDRQTSTDTDLDPLRQREDFKRSWQICSGGRRLNRSCDHDRRKRSCSSGHLTTVSRARPKQRTIAQAITPDASTT